MHVGIAGIFSGGPLQTLQRSRRLASRHVGHSEIERNVREGGIGFQRRKLFDSCGEIVGPQIETSQVVIHARPVVIRHGECNIRRGRIPPPPLCPLVSDDGRQ